MTDLAVLLREFHEHPRCAPEQHELRIVLHREEHRELEDELEVPVESIDRLRLARELADVVYVSFGTAHVFEIDLNAAVGIIHAKAMEKLVAGHRRADGKVVKPPGFVPPDLRPALL